MDGLTHVFDVLLPEIVHICVSYTVAALIVDVLTHSNDGRVAESALLACPVHLT
jgi:hypothetical protein